MRTYEDMRPVDQDRSRWTLPCVLEERAAQDPDHVFLKVPQSEVVLTFAQTLEGARNVARGLIGGMCEPRDRVLIMANNSANYVLAWLGSALAGLIEVPINTAYRGRFFAHQASNVQATAAIIDPEFADRFVQEREACSEVRCIYLFGGNEEARAAAAADLRAAGYACSPFEELLAPSERPLPAVEPTDLAAIFFTSGTTGLSKGVMVSHAQMYFFANQSLCLSRIDHTDVVATMGPMFHGSAQMIAGYPALLAGATFVLYDRFSASEWIARLRDCGATVTNIMGVMMDFIWQQPRREDDADNRLRSVLAGPTAHSIVDPFMERFGIEAVVETFGLTEVSLPIMSPYGEPRPPGAAGLGVEQWFDIRLVDPDTDEPVADGDVGELVVRPRVPFIMSDGYFGMPERTLNAMRNLWFHTGDGMRRDDNGWYYFVDRLKDAIRRRGENISSYEVEQALLTLDGVRECAVVGVPSDVEAGEDEVLAVVVTDGTGEPSPEHLWAHAQNSLPYFAVPRYLRFMESLPMTPSGKIRKVELREAGTSAPGTIERQMARSATRRM